MALGMRDKSADSNTPVQRSETTAPTTSAATAPVATENKPAVPAFVFEDATVPGRGQTEIEDPEYTALKAKVAEHWRSVKAGAVSGNAGVAFNSPTGKRHVGMLRKAAQEIGCGISIRPSTEIPVGPVRILFRTKVAKVYNKDGK
jgi:hypothetical protein